jgi:hypothetical protein
LIFDITGYVAHGRSHCSAHHHLLTAQPFTPLAFQMIPLLPFSL